jgi:hypothetical protein
MHKLSGLQLLGLSAIGVVAVSAILRVLISPAFRQQDNEVVIREPGERLLGRPQPLADEARKDVDFAFLSQAAYQRTANSKIEKTDCYLNPDETLESSGWKRWTDFPDTTVLAKIEKSHLRVEVWENAQRDEVALAFGGTVFTNKADWRANLRWFMPTKQDEYTQIVEVLGPSFINEFLEREARGELRNTTKLFATGHSLGGGLAQEFAYSLPLNPSVPRVTQVYAFDPSPVTGYFSVDKGTRDINTKTLCIDRIYERGEILAILRSFTNFILPPSATNPVIRQIRYKLFSRAPITGHSISLLACKLKTALSSQPTASTTN